MSAWRCFFCTLGRLDRCFEGIVRAGMLVPLPDSFEIADCEALAIHEGGVEQIHLLGHASRDGEVAIVGGDAGGGGVTCTVHHAGDRHVLLCRQSK